jgi:hypothetical protein
MACSFFLFDRAALIPQPLLPILGEGEPEFLSFQITYSKLKA